MGYEEFLPAKLPRLRKFPDPARFSTRRISSLRPEDEMEFREASLVDRNGFLVFTGTQPFDAVQVIMAARTDREDDLLVRFKIGGNAANLPPVTQRLCLRMHSSLLGRCSEGLRGSPASSRRDGSL